MYLLMRAGAMRRDGAGNGNPPLIIWFVAFILGVAGLLLYGLLTGHPLAPGLPGGTA